MPTTSLATLAIAACGALGVSCTADSGTPQRETEPGRMVDVSFTTIDRAAPLGGEPTQPLYRLVACPGDWTELRDLLPQPAFEAGARVQPPGERLFVVAFAGIKLSSGHHAAVDRIVQADAEVVVSVSQASPSPDDIVEPASTLPYHVVTFLKSELPSLRFTRVTFRSTDGLALYQQDLAFPKSCNSSGSASGEAR